jgi:hypothetical protein
VDSEQWTVNSGSNSGEWTVNSGPFAVNSGQFAVNSGQWTVEYGQWTMVSGEWIVGSVQCTVSNNSRHWIVSGLLSLVWQYSVKLQTIF